MTLPELSKRFTEREIRLLRLGRQWRLATSHFINRYWLRLTVVGFFIGVLCLKDVTVELRWQHPSVTSNSSPTNSPPPPSAAAFTRITDSSPTEKAQPNNRLKQLNYVKRFAKVAQTEMDKYGIPASITLAQGLLETNAGNSPLAAKLNNHFGIKCFSKRCKKGHCANFSDDTHKDFFRIYPTAWESFRAHSKLLQSNRYRPLYNLPNNDYIAWANGLKKAGYATDKNYPQKLVRLIETLNLQQYDS